MTHTIYDFRDSEIKVARQIRRERRAAIVEAVIGLPLLAICAIVFILGCAVM